MIVLSKSDLKKLILIKFLMYYNKTKDRIIFIRKTNSELNIQRKFKLIIINIIYKIK